MTVSVEKSVECALTGGGRLKMISKGANMEKLAIQMIARTGTVQKEIVFDKAHFVEMIEELWPGEVAVEWYKEGK